jgi:hypothetical protein
VFSLTAWELHLRGRQKLAGLSKTNHLRLVLDIDIVYGLYELYDK